MDLTDITLFVLVVCALLMSIVFIVLLTPTIIEERKETLDKKDFNN